ncbi:MAG: hypothetical protein GX858_09645, partial [Clostridiales bacterium]|nr:hypothetical protein [Clostridiales bacterium]
MTIPKTLAALLAALVLFTFLPLSLAEDIPTVILGDGAPIPYLSDFTSRLMKDSAMMPGITGSTDLIWLQAGDLGSQVTVQLQNIALTDDVLAVFYRAQYK